MTELNQPATKGQAAGQAATVAADPNPLRRVVLSESACDFTTGIGPGSIKEGYEGRVLFSLGTNPYGYPALATPNRKYYANIKNAAACSSSTCDLYIELAPPR